ncbi:MAG TPA: energy transducer TonB, partial [Chitinophagaceae bacterium]|nr:energy transducer TonB [Chitinophagaceae bacterium]
YELRLNYPRRARKALFWVVGSALLLCSVPLFASLFPEKNPGHYDHPMIDSFQIIEVDLTKKPPETQPSHASKPPVSGNHIPTKIVPPSVIYDIDTLLAAPSGPSNPGMHATDPGDDGSGSHATGQTTTSTSVIDFPADNTLYSDADVQQLPEFPGGEEALESFLSTNIHYPRQAVDRDVEGKVVVQFVVDKDGSIESMQVVRSLGYGCDDEALRVLAKMPAWKAAKQNGHPVKVSLTLPVQFVLER